MIDWVAVGSLATVATVCVGYLQFRQAKSASTHSHTASRTNAGTVATASTVLPPPTLHYSISSGQGDYVFPDGWNVSLEHPQWIAQQQMLADLRNFGFIIFTLKNNNDFPVHNVLLDLEMSRLWSARVESAETLSKLAIELLKTDNGLRVSVGGLPAGEEIKISATCGGYPSSYPSTVNAAVNLKKAVMKNG